MKYLYLALAFTVGVFVYGCSGKKAEQAAYAKGCEAGINEVITQQGMTPNPEPIKAFCDKAAKSASEES